MREMLYLGIDGGATACRARLTDQSGRVLGEGRAGPANPRLDADGSRASILAATRQALDRAGLDEGAFRCIRAGLGLAGLGQAKDRDAFALWRHPFATMMFTTDAETALMGAHGGGDGAILILGTGSCGFARVRGDLHRVGGWGFPISDAGSGAWLGLMAIRRALDAHDGVCDQTALTRAVLARFGDDAEAVVAFSETAKPGDYAAIAPLVLAHSDDPIGHALIGAAAADAADLVRALRRIGAERVCLMGGLASHLLPVMPADAIDGLSAPVGDALDGALALARLA